MRQSVLQYLEASTKTYPHKVAVIDETKRLSYAGLLDSCQATGSALAEVTNPGNGVGVYLTKSIDALCSMLGALYAGCYYTTLNTELPAPRLQQIVSVLKPSVIVTCKDLKEQADEIFAGSNVVLVEDLLQHDINRAALDRSGTTA